MTDRNITAIAENIKSLEELADYLNGLNPIWAVIDAACEIHGWHRISRHPTILCHDGVKVLVRSARIDTVFVDLIDNAYAEWVGYQLRNARQMQNLTLKQVAAMSGIPFQTIAKIEAGKRSPRAGTLARLVLALGICLRF